MRKKHTNPNCSCASCKAKRGENKGINHSFYNKHHVGKTKEKMSKNHANFIGINNPNWKNGIRKHGDGYILIYLPTHPYKNKENYVMEHRLIMEKHLKRYLTSEEVVHHINGIRDDNRIENLKLCENRSEHRKLHRKIGIK